MQLAKNSHMKVKGFPFQPQQPKTAPGRVLALAFEFSAFLGSS